MLRTQLEGVTMVAATLKRKIAFSAAIAGLCATLAGCAADVGAQPASQSTNPQLRYYGGPKYPMWPAQ
jgi:hypothetical protein